MKKISILVVVILLILNESALAICAGPPIDIITRFRWNCVLPITIGGIPIGGSGNALADYADQKTGPGTQLPVCICKDPLPRIGITLGYREPIKIIETVKDAFCLPILGMGLSQSAWSGGTKGQASSPKNDFMNTHMWEILAYKLLGLFMDVVCLSGQGPNLSMAYMSELDITSRSDVAAAILNPEAVLFANPVAIMACEIPDALYSIQEMTVPPLYWCAGNHAIFPLSNNQISKSNYVEAAEVAASKTVFKMHRELQLWGSLGTQGLCGVYPMPIWNKLQYRLQAAMPVPDWYCRRLGQPSLIWNRGLNPSGAPNMDNMAWILWRKRDCCVF